MTQVAQRRTAEEYSCREYTLKRATQCRCCGQSMPKGTTVLKVPYDIYEGGSPDPIRGMWVDCYLHKEACRAVKPITEYSYSQLA